MNRKDVFDKLFNAYNYGNLGMFIGAGFSKSVINDKVKKALGWFELIEKTCDELDIEFPNDSELIGMSLPEVSTKLCKQLEQNSTVENYSEAKLKFKNKICEITNWLPNEEKTKIFKELFKNLNPSWIITTNYDLVLETILTGSCKSLSSINYLSAPKGIIPIYHIHGIRREPESIIITQDDYIPIFRPNEYRQTKLALTIRESTTLVLGYGLGDMNVLSALDWSKNIYTHENEYPYEIIQAIWTETPEEKPYIDENKNIIIEINDIQDFLQELTEYISRKKKEYDVELTKLRDLMGALDNNENQLLTKFKSKQNFRLKLLELLSKFEYNMIDSYISFFNTCIKDIWIEARKDGAFKKYNQYLSILLDVVINYDYTKMPPKLFKIVAEALNSVLIYISKEPNNKSLGRSWVATETWHKEKDKISLEMQKQLYYYANQNDLFNLEEFFKSCNS